MKGILWYVTRKLEGIFDGILMEFRRRISEDEKKSMYIPRFLSSSLHGRILLIYILWVLLVSATKVGLPPVHGYSLFVTPPSVVPQWEVVFRQERG